MMYKQKQQAPQKVNAIQFDGFNCVEVMKFIDKADQIEGMQDDDAPRIVTPEGTMLVSVGTYLVKNVGQVHLVGKEQFESNFEEDTASEIYGQQASQEI